ncbi:MAG: CotH kinase family protein [Bacteroidota bacterium]
MYKPASLFLMIFWLVFNLPLSAQPQFTPDGEIYIKSVVPRVDIIIHPDTLNWIYENVESDMEFHAVFVFDNGNVHDTINDIGFRLRGNTSRHSAKKSFKVSFNTWVQGRKYHGIEKMNLNGEHNDPSIVRARLYWDILKRSVLAGPRANHVQVFINGNYYGLYLNCEHIDEEFVESYYGNNNGNLYKCLWPADLTYRGADPDEYKFTSGDRRTYDLKTNEEADDYSDLAEFITILNNTPTDDLPCELEKLFNVQDYLKVAAIDVLTANWDGYIYNKNNFYLYHNTFTGLFEYIPYDTDNTFGIDWFNIDWSARDIYTWSNTNEERPLFTRLMQVPEYRAWYTYYIRQIINEVTGSQDFLNSLMTLKEQLDDYVVSDPFYPLDYGYTINSFNTSFTEGTGNHVPVGIQPYILTRNSIALSQADNTDSSPILKYLTHNSPGAWENMIVSAWAEDEGLNSVIIDFRINGHTWQQSEMNDDGLDGDTLAGDHVFTVTIPGMAGNTLFEFSIKATDNNQQSMSKPCIPIQYTVPAGNAYGLFINEFMASNNTTITDDFGEFDDWIELYNGGSESVWLGDKYLSDNLANPSKWALPDISLAAGGFLLVWADDQPEQGPLHSNYKLDRDFEEIGLFDNVATGYALLDGLSYSVQSTDISFGRITDGSSGWKFFDAPTPGSTNSLVIIEERALTKLIIWPNPATGGTIYLAENTNFSIYDLTGRRLNTYTNSRQADVSTLNPGLYLVITDKGTTNRLIIY